MSFADHILDGVTPQVFLLAFDDKTVGFNLLSSLEGDFTTDPVEINRPFLTGDKTRFGCVPSATMSCTLQNADNRYSGFPFGKARAYIGTYEGDTTVGTFQVNGINIIIGGGMRDELVIGSDEIPDTSGVTVCYIFSLVSTYYAYFIDDNGKVRQVDIEDTTNDTVLGDPCQFFTKACSKDYAVVYLETWDEIHGTFNLHLYDGQKESLYELCPVGVFNISRPRSTSTVTISITDAFDDMRRLDVSCGDFVQHIQTLYPGGSCLVGDFVDELLTDFSYQYWVTYPTVYVRTDLFNRKDYTYRELLHYAAEAMCKCVYFDAVGDLEFQDPAEDPLVPPPEWQDSAIFPMTRIMANGYDRADFTTGYYDGVNLYMTDGTVWLSGTYTEEELYVITENPLIDPSTLQDADYISRVGHLPVYHPMTVTATELNPALRPGAVVSVQNIYTGNYELAPAWEIDIIWAGKTYGTVIAGGVEHALY